MIRIESGALRADILPTLGAGLAALDLRGPSGAWHALLRRAPADARWFNDLASYLLAPWPNRIAAGRFEWDGLARRVAPDWPDGTAIHGRIKDRAFSVVERTPVTAILEFDSAGDSSIDWPWAFRCRVRYEILDDAIDTRVTLQNTGSSSMPAGLGFHPFFSRVLWDQRDEVELRYTPRGRYPCAAMLPEAPAQADDLVHRMQRGPIPIRELHLDDVFLGSTDGATLTWPASGVRAAFECSPELGHGVLYTQQPGSFCFEPVTMVNNGFNLSEEFRTGVLTVEPGAAVTARSTLRVQRF